MRIPTWWQRVSTLQYRLYQLREHALVNGDQETAAECKRLLLDAETLVKLHAPAWIAAAEALLPDTDDRNR